MVVILYFLLTWIHNYRLHVIFFWCFLSTNLSGSFFHVLTCITSFRYRSIPYNAFIVCYNYIKNYLSSHSRHFSSHCNASRSDPSPYFTYCMQNHIMTVPFSLSCHRKKNLWVYYSNIRVGKYINNKQIKTMVKSLSAFSCS